MKWTNALKESSKDSLKPNAASHNNTSWYTDMGGCLEHSSSGGNLYYMRPALQEIIPVFGGSLLVFRLPKHAFIFCEVNVLIVLKFNSISVYF